MLGPRAQTPREPCPGGLSTSLHTLGVTPPGLQGWGRERGAGRLCRRPQMALTHLGRCPTPQAWHLASCDACDPIELSSWVSRVRAEGTRGTLTVTPSALCCVPSITAPATRTPTAHSHRPCICQRAYKSPCLEGALEGWSVVAVISRQASLPGSRRAAPKPESLPGSRRAAPEPGSLPGSRRAAPEAGSSGRGKKGKGGARRTQAWGVETPLRAPLEAEAAQLLQALPAWGFRSRGQ